MVAPGPPMNRPSIIDRSGPGVPPACWSCLHCVATPGLDCAAVAVRRALARGGTVAKRGQHADGGPRPCPWRACSHRGGSGLTAEQPTAL